MSLSVVIVTKNEEASLARALDSVRFADEIIVLDSGSADRTLDIARSSGAKVFVEEWKGYAAQKNSAVAKATCEWVLSLDADEVLEPALAAEIQTISRDGACPVSGYFIPFKHHFLGRWLRWGGMYPDRKLRLFRRGHGHFPARAVHESVQVTGATAAIARGAILHYGYPTLDVYLASMDRYSTLAAEQMLRDRRRPLPFLDTVLRPALTFLARYIFLLGFLDGREGLLFHYQHARYVRAKYLKALAASRSRR